MVLTGAGSLRAHIRANRGCCRDFIAVPHIAVRYHTSFISNQMEVTSTGSARVVVAAAGGTASGKQDSTLVRYVA